MGRWAPAFVWMAVIWILSARGRSGEDSGFLLATLLSWFGHPEGPDPYVRLAVHAAARKMAHLSAYAVQALLAVRALGVRRLGLAWCWAVLWAVMDEWHQSMVPGRSGQLRDVMIDGAGATWALLGLWIHVRLPRAPGRPAGPLPAPDVA